MPVDSETPYVLVDAAGTARCSRRSSATPACRGPCSGAQAQAEAAAAAALAAAEAEPEPEAAADAAAAGAGRSERAAAAHRARRPSVTVDVLNATPTGGLAATVGDQLAEQGFSVGDVGNESAAVDHTVVRHGSGAAEQARTVAAAVPGADLVPDEQIAATPSSS